MSDCRLLFQSCLFHCASFQRFLVFFALFFLYVFIYFLSRFFCVFFPCFQIPRPISCVCLHCFMSGQYLWCHLKWLCQLMGWVPYHFSTIAQFVRIAWLNQKEMKRNWFFMSLNFCQSAKCAHRVPFLLLDTILNLNCHFMFLPHQNNMFSFANGTMLFLVLITRPSKE